MTWRWRREATRHGNRETITETVHSVLVLLWQKQSPLLILFSRVQSTLLLLLLIHKQHDRQKAFPGKSFSQKSQVYWWRSFLCHFEVKDVKEEEHHLKHHLMKKETRIRHKQEVSWKSKSNRSSSQRIVRSSWIVFLFLILFLEKDARGEINRDARFLQILADMIKRPWSGFRSASFWLPRLDLFHSFRCYSSKKKDGKRVRRQRVFKELASHVQTLSTRVACQTFYGSPPIPQN